MNWIPSAVPPATILVEWTVLLTLAWLMHGLLRDRHARWRVLLWRSVLVFGLALPLVHLPSVSGLKLPQPISAAAAEVLAQPRTQAQNLAAAPLPDPAPRPAPKLPRASASPATGLVAAGEHHSLLLVWAAGLVVAALRLARLQSELSRAIAEAAFAEESAQQQVNRIRLSLGLGTPVLVRESEKVRSPFIAGIRRPVILIPRRFFEELSPAEMSALLRHELAHLLGHDLAWCLAWRWMRAVCWFHPLVWRIPAAHNLSCEEEADRVAGGDNLEERSGYRQLLAKLALRVLAVPEVETEMTLNGASQIAQRLNYLQQTRRWAWVRTQTFGAVGLSVGLFLIAGIVGGSLVRAVDPTPATGAPAEPAAVMFAPPAANFARVDLGAKLSATTSSGETAAAKVIPAGLASPSVGPKTDNEYRLRVGDRVKIEVDNEPDMALTTKVDSQSRLNLPLIGSVAVANLTLRQAERAIQQLYQDRRFMRNPKVKLEIIASPPEPAVNPGVNPSVVEIQVEADGLYSIENEALSLSELKGRLKGYASLPKAPTVRLNADGRTRYDNVVRVMDALQEAGLANFTLSTGLGSPQTPAQALLKADLDSIASDEVQLNAAIAHLAVLRSRYLEAHPAVVAQLETIAALKAEIERLRAKH